MTRRLIALAVLATTCAFAGWWFFVPALAPTPSLDRGHHGLWLAHGWLGADAWYEQNHRWDQVSKYRTTEARTALVQRMNRAHVTDVFPHLCPPGEAALPLVDDAEVEDFLDAMPASVRVMPWIGGPHDAFLLSNPRWVQRYLQSVTRLFDLHPRLAGVHLNVEPLPSGEQAYLDFLRALRLAIPEGKVLSVAAYPPPTPWQPTLDVHWEEKFFRQVAERVDQLVPMLYDTSVRQRRAYVRLVAEWSTEVLAWADGKPVLLGLPAYDDEGVGYHLPEVENLETGLLGVSRALGDLDPPANYQGLALYSDWELDEAEWSLFERTVTRAGSSALPR